MTRDEQLKEIDLKYQPLIDEKTLLVAQAHSDYQQVMDDYSQVRQQVNEYFDALEKKAAAEVVIDKGLPKV